MEEKAARLFNRDEQAYNGQATSGEVETTETLSLVSTSDSKDSEKLCFPWYAAHNKGTWTRLRER